MTAQVLVRGWASSTEGKIRQFVDQYLINYPQENVRRSTEKLLASLFRKGSEPQRQDILALLTQRAQQLDSMGRSSTEFLSLATSIFQGFPAPLYSAQKALFFGAVLAKTQEVFAKTVGGKEYGLYSLCANMIDFGGEFKPYLLEANGCLKCFGKPEVEWESASLASLKDELRTHLNSVEWVLKRRYELSNLQVTLGKKKIGFKSMAIYAVEEGVRRELGRFAPNDPIPPFSLTASAIGLTFEFAKPRRNHITCVLCSSGEEYAVVCSSCISKLVDMEARVKVVGGSPEKVNRELTESFRSFTLLRAQLEAFAQSVGEQSRVGLVKAKIVQEMESAYLSIIQNLRLLREASEGELLAERRRYESLCTDCYSCHFYEFSACLSFLLGALKQGLFQPAPDQVAHLITAFRAIFAANRIRSNNEPLACILAELFSRAGSVDYWAQVGQGGEVAGLLASLLQHLKREGKEESLQQLKQLVLAPQVNQHFSLQQRVQLFVVLVLSEEHLFYLADSEELDPEKLQDLKRLSLPQFEEYRPLLAFEVRAIFDHKINNVFKLFLVLLPEELVPESSLDIADAGYLRYIRTVLPVISEETILANVVFSPHPIIKLNMFRLLPQLVQQLPLESSIELVQQLCRFRPLWNTYIRETVECFDRLLEGVEKERKLLLCLEGFAVSRESLYFEHVYRILTPQRPSFIIRLEIPEKEMQKEEKNKGGPVEYIYLPVREVRSEELKGDTMGALHEWITEEIRKLNQDMAFDLIVENNIVDNLELSLEIVYRRIVQKEARRQIGSKSYDFFRVIYRIQGIFGEANERNCGNPRDEKLEECINFSSYLLGRLPCRATGLQVLLGVIPTLEREGRDRREKLIRILEVIFRNESIIRKVVEWEFGNHILTLTVRSISLQKQDLRATESLLEMCSRIIDEANKEMVRLRKNSGVSERKSSAELEEEGEESGQAVRFVLERVREADEKGLKHLSKKLIKILPFCSRDDASSSRYLLDYFEMGRLLELKHTQKLAWLLEFIQALSESYVSFKALCRQEGITARLVELLAGGVGEERGKEALESLELGVVVLKGLLQGDVQLQEELFEKGILQELYRVGAAGGEEARARLGKIPSVCFEIVKYFHEGKMISQQVAAFFQEQEERKRRAIQSQKNQRKQEIMSKKRRVMESYQHLMRGEESELLACSSCKEGYSKKREVLGVYLYSSKLEILSLEGWWRENKRVQSVTSTSYFEPIHLDCHNNAMKDDLKIQKTEWDGAIIRNSEVLCNNWCAFKGPDTSDEEFDRVYRKYFEKNNKANPFWIAFNDLNGLLEKFSREFNFAQETKGSSHSHNAKLIPVLLGLACHLLRGGEEVKYLREGITAIEEHLTKKPNLINLYFCLLLLHSNAAAFPSKRPFCLRLIDHLGYANFKDSKPFYVYLALVQSILRLTHQTSAEGFEVVQHLSAYIPKNFTALLQSLEVVAEEYKNVYLRWENIEQAKKYFEP